MADNRNRVVNLFTPSDFTFKTKNEQRHEEFCKELNRLSNVFGDTDDGLIFARGLTITWANENSVIEGAYYDLINHFIGSYESKDYRGHNANDMFSRITNKLMRMHKRSGNTLPTLFNLIKRFLELELPPNHIIKLSYQQMWYINDKEENLLGVMYW